MTGQNNLSTRSHWLPFTANRQFHRDPSVIVEADDCHFISQDGREIYDSLSGLWCSGYGHNRKEINEAVTKQLETLDFAPSFQFTHPGATELADRLIEIVPTGLDHVLFANSGSECADTSLKIARAYWRMQGKPSKTRFIG